MFMDDKTRLSYWFPLIEDAGLPIPKTAIIKATEDELRGLWGSFENRETHIKAKGLAARIAVEADRIGYPCFLRTDHFSGKHNWEKCCFIEKREDILSHMINIAYQWELVNFVASPADVWVVREFLPTIPLGVCKKYGNMPICREFRFFVEDGLVKCFHPYWPESSLEDGAANYPQHFDYESFSKPADTAEEALLHALAAQAGQAVGGCWSVDLLQTKNGWYLTDMAEAKRSWHMPGCEMKEYFAKKK